MSTDAAGLPDDDDIGQLKQLVVTQRGQVEHLKLLLGKLKGMQLGRSSEKLDRETEQLELQLEELEVSQDQIRPAARKPAKQAKREPFPEHLPCERRANEPPSTCPDCGGPLCPDGEDASEMLEHAAEQFKVIRIVRPKLACLHCERIVQEPAPSRPIAKGMAGPGLLAHILAGKYCDHLPLYRQSQIYARQGVELERSTLAEWVGQCLELVNPLVEALGRYVLAGDKLHAVDAPMPVLDPGRGRTKTGRLWTYVRDDRAAGSSNPPAVLFRYSADRRAQHPQEHLKDFVGILQADVYSGFDTLYGRGGIQAAACWAHARNGFHDIYAATQSPIAAEALERIAALYAIEAEIRGKPPPERALLRRARAGPLLETLRTWLRDTLARVSKESALFAATGFVLTRWTALTRYCADGRIEIDNSAAEGALRAIAMGRKSFHFAGSDAGAARAAAMYSLIGTAKLNALDPEAYLRDILCRIGDHQVKRIDELLPWAIAAERHIDARLAA